MTRSKGLGWVTMDQQANGSSCWIAAARFCLRCLGRPVLQSQQAMIQSWQTQNAYSHAAMTGAGSPEAILDIYGVQHHEVSRDCTIEQQREAVATWLASGRPVLAGLASQHIMGFRHAVVLIGASPSCEMIAIRDPATGRSDHPRYVSSTQLFEEGFVYSQLGDRMTSATAIWVWCYKLVLVG